MSKLSQKIEQRQKLSPRQILEANIVQLNHYNLEKRIIEELENNPTLEIEEENEEAQLEENEEDENKFDLEDLESSPEDYEIARNTSFKSQDVDNVISLNSTSLTEDFIKQLYDINYSDDKIVIAEEILGNLDDRGYLTIDSQLIADRMQIDQILVQNVIEDIKFLDPPGIASSSIKECILAQLKVYYPNKIFCQEVVDNYFEELSNKNFSKIKIKTGCSDEALYEVNELVSVLNPNPGINYNSSITNHITPDIVVEKDSDGWVVLINEPSFSNLKINRHYSELLSSNLKDKNANDFIKNKVKNGQWFIEALKKRSETIRKVVLSIISQQNTYFTFDDRELTPMILEDVAKDIDMDISTISRVTNGKYAQLPWGVKELKDFFTIGVKMKDGSVVSSSKLKKEIINLIDSENKTKPHTDEELKILLNKRGYQLARRTVSKYREVLKFPKSRLRKTLI